MALRAKDVLDLAATQALLELVDLLPLPDFCHRRHGGIALFPLQRELGWEIDHILVRLFELALLCSDRDQLIVFIEQTSLLQLGHDLTLIDTR